MSTTYTHLQTQTLTGEAASVTFTGIPQNFSDLKICISGRITGYSNVSYDYLGMTFNNDTSSSYDNISLYGNGSSSAAFEVASTTSVRQVVTVPSAGASAGVFGNAEFYIPNYTGSNYKTVEANSVTENNATQVYTQISSSVWNKSNAITSLSIFPLQGTAFVAGSTFTLYGVSNGVKATGGTLTVAGGYAYHTFTSTGTFTPTQRIKNAEVLCVAGGGGGGMDFGGGGGAGGYRSLSLSIPMSTYTCLVGAGGSGGTGRTNGSDSVFYSLISTGGGRGADGGSRNPLEDGANGGSGGGSAGTNFKIRGLGNTPATSPSQGNNGGTSGAGSASTSAGSGGGGAGAIGNSNSGGNGGSGGAGSNAHAAWASVTGTGASGYFAGGGGGGGGDYGGNGGAGGAGGGGAANTGYAANGNAATSNTGGGGGAGTYGGGSGGAGGSGIIIIRYPL